MLESGYIKLYRSLLSWEWYGDINTRVLFIHLLLTVNHERQRWRGITVDRGQRVTSFPGLAQETGLSLQNVKTAVAHLQSTGELTYCSTAKYSVFTVNNYEKYQGVTYSQPTEPQQANHQLTTKEESKKVRKEEEENPPKSPQGEQAESLAVEMAAGTAKAADHSTTPEQQGFDEFWEAYPRKIGKGAARKAWEKIRPGESLAAEIVAAVHRDRKTEQWRRDSGKYIPHPATWLNQERWEDDPEASSGERKASYDIDELEEMSRFDLPDEL